MTPNLSPSISSPDDSRIAQRVAAEQLAWWRRRCISPLEASVALGITPTPRWDRVEAGLIRKWREAIEIIAEREEIRSAA